MRRSKIIYWISTVWLGLGMASTGVVQIIRMEEEVQKMSALGYQPYFLVIIGVWKILGTCVILLPGLPLLKEWAYAGFFFLMTGAVFSHFAIRDSAEEYFGPLLLLTLTIVSWYFRPGSRRTVSSIT